MIWLTSKTTYVAWIWLGEIILLSRLPRITCTLNQVLCVGTMLAAYLAMFARTGDLGDCYHPLILVETGHGTSNDNEQ